MQATVTLRDIVVVPTQSTRYFCKSIGFREGLSAIGRPDSAWPSFCPVRPLPPTEDAAHSRRARGLAQRRLCPGALAKSACVARESAARFGARSSGHHQLSVRNCGEITMIKVVAPAQRHLSNRETLEHFQRYWGESHGPLFANTKRLRRYVQHLTLPESYGIRPRTDLRRCLDVLVRRGGPVQPRRREGRDGLDPAERGKPGRPDSSSIGPIPGRCTTRAPRSRRWKRSIVDGRTTPEMVKAIFIASKIRGSP